MKSLADPAVQEELLSRLRRVRPDTPRRWGRMSAPQMVCHLGDSFKGVMGLRGIIPATTLLNRTLVRCIALHTPLPWPKGVPTRPEVDQEVGGTPPGEFERDVRDLEALIERFARPLDSTRGGPRRDFERQSHPIFGPLTEREWLRWGWRHADHHLRQFGV